MTDHRITGPGKFEGEMSYVEEYWNLALDGGADSDDGNTFVFKLTAEDRAKHPDFKGCRRLYLWESEQGFVYSRLA